MMNHSKKEQNSMITEGEDFHIDYVNDKLAVISGILRLPSPTEYEKSFKNIFTSIEKNAADNSTYTIDISDLKFLNSSGITGFARIILLARAKNVPLVIQGKESIPWQKKSIVSLNKLWEKVEIKLI